MPQGLGRPLELLVQLGAFKQVTPALGNTLPSRTPQLTAGAASC